jgi:uncharacterized damage-inducible protein DinB
MPKAAPPPWSVPESLLKAFDTNERVNQFLLENLPLEAWRAAPPDSKGRNVSGIVSHMHNVRIMWLKAAAKGSSIPSNWKKQKSRCRRPARLWTKATQL